MKDGIAVLVPIYKMLPDELEVKVLERNLRMLNAYALVIVCPKSLDIGNYSYFQFDKVERFDDEYFIGLEGYNKLLRSGSFYKRFESYEYILIAQTDVYIFKSDLTEFVLKNYDYWGAPWIDYELINYKFLRPVLPFSHKYRQLRRIRGVLGPRYLVGNGGLSLRKVKTHLDITCNFRDYISKFEEDYETWINGGAKSMMEDVFWSLYVKRVYPAYSVAPWREALRFSFEMGPRTAFLLNGGQLPFGCHAFDKVDPDFVQQFLEFPLKNV